ncbi:ABC transporter substrate-binding protein [Oceaniglobus trochenteri]|uniref:ABC transporter substrate-binding protein n=1 Tax=Oceaniglobus trochenteri TaxID=2763260 RepID=UPI001CFFD5AC|nr:ABC transporter substrate-binding protein [Oceaniglobus trochenteri]
MTKLKGMTWSHPRGYDPMVACSADWAARGGAEIEWDKRSLQGFESFPVEQLAREYDLIVIDHPHVGQCFAEGCLLALPEAPEITGSSVGQSVDSYRWQGERWAWPIDAAAQVQAIRPDLADGPARDWAAVMELAQQGKVLIPLRDPHALMAFFTLVANDGHPCRADGPGAFVDRAAGRRALQRLRDLAALVDQDAYEMDPIAVLERMSETEIACAPLIYGYINYSLPGFRANPVTFHDIPSVAPGGGVAGSALGGTGIAVSAFSRNPEAALAFARYVAGPEVQAARFVSSGGQAGHRAAWTDDSVDRAAGHFYSGTLATLDGAWMRPRHDGYMGFQGPASARVSQALRDGDLDGALDDLQRLFDESFRS